jgi:hypothetical protein
MVSFGDPKWRWRLGRRRTVLGLTIKRILVSALVIPFVAGATLVAPGAGSILASTNAGAVAPGSCGSVLLSGASWLGGSGVNVYSNGAFEGSGNSCGGNYVNGVLSGAKWQCVELVNRLYLSKGWISSHWFGNGDTMYNSAPGNLTKQANGSVSALGPGDVISIQEFYNGQIVTGGHVLIVNDGSTVSNGTVALVSQNSGSSSSATVTGSATISGGTVTVLGGGGGWSYSVVGVIHAPVSNPVSIAGGPSMNAKGTNAVAEGPSNSLYYWWNAAGTWYGPIQIGVAGSAY